MESFRKLVRWHLYLYTREVVCIFCMYIDVSCWRRWCRKILPLVFTLYSWKQSMLTFVSNLLSGKRFENEIMYISLLCSPNYTCVFCGKIWYHLLQNRSGHLVIAAPSVPEIHMHLTREQSFVLKFATTRSTKLYTANSVPCVAANVSFLKWIWRHCLLLQTSALHLLTH